MVHRSAKGCRSIHADRLRNHDPKFRSGPAMLRLSTCAPADLVPASTRFLDSSLHPQRRSRLRDAHSWPTMPRPRTSARATQPTGPWRSSTMPPSASRTGSTSWFASRARRVRLLPRPHTGRLRYQSNPCNRAASATKFARSCYRGSAMTQSLTRIFYG